MTYLLEILLIPSDFVPLSNEIQYHVDNVQSNTENSSSQKVFLILSLWKSDLDGKYNYHDTDLNDVDEAPNAEHNGTKI